MGSPNRGSSLWFMVHCGENIAGETSERMGVSAASPRQIAPLCHSWFIISGTGEKTNGYGPRLALDILYPLAYLPVHI